MSAASISVTPGKQFAPGEQLTYAGLNALGQPVLILTGAFGTLQIQDAAVTTTKIADGNVTEAKLANATFTPDANGVAPFAAGWLSNLFLSQKTMPLQGRTNVVATNNAGTPNTKADITADELVLKDTSGNVYVVTTVSLTVDITASGANGLDTGAAAGSTWYYLYVIWNGTTVSGLVSLSATAPTMPSGYTYKALVGAVYNNGSSQFTKFRVQNRRVFLAEAVLFTAFAATTSWAIYTTNVAAAVPPIAKIMYGTLGTVGAGGVGLAGDANGVGACYAVGAANATTLDSFQAAGQFSVPLITSQTLYVIASGTTANNRAVCTGYEF